MSDSAMQNIQDAIGFHRAGDFPAAEAIYRALLAKNPADAALASNLADVLRRQGRVEEAIELCRRGISLRPDFSAAHGNLGIALLEAGDAAGAITAMNRAVELGAELKQLAPSLARAHAAHARRLRAANAIDDAFAHAHHAAALAPALPEAHNTLAAMWIEIGDADTAIAHLRRAVELAPEDPAIHSNLLLDLHFSDAIDPKSLFEEHQSWAQRHLPSLAASRTTKSFDRDPDRPLRVAFTSPDFCAHPVGRFFLPLFENRDRESFHITCYSDTRDLDETTRQFQAGADQWRDTRPLTHERLADQIAADRIDILIDTTGHTARNRLLAFARQPAPVQVTYLGYPDTTAVPQIAFRLTDAIADPFDGVCTEKLIRVPRCAWCFSPPPEAPPVALRDSAAPIAFGSFNALAKLSPRTIALWSRVLEAAPESRLVLKARGSSSTVAQRRLRGLFAARSIDPARLEFLPPLDAVADHLAAYRAVDIALDTLPYNGTTTTCEALWMGVPVVTCTGDRHASRVGASLLTNAGLPELIAHDEATFVHIATELAGDVARRTLLRRDMRDRLRVSTLMDAAGLARGFFDTLRRLWREYCQSCDL